MKNMGSGVIGLGLVLAVGLCDFLHGKWNINYAGKDNTYHSSGLIREWQSYYLLCVIIINITAILLSLLSWQGKSFVVICQRQLVVLEIF